MTGCDWHVVDVITGFPVGHGLHGKGEGGSRGSRAVGEIEARDERWVRLGDGNGEK